MSEKKESKKSRKKDISYASWILTEISLMWKVRDAYYAIWRLFLAGPVHLLISIIGRYIQMFYN